ncbi:two-component system response regulator [Priestia megaterium]|nr:two-component system response regulator [Priestia megaterium]
MKKILIVDDSVFMRQIIKKALEETDIEIIEAQNGKEAVEIYEKERPHIVTMDIVMPEKTGLEALQTILAQDPDAKIIICSSMVNKRTDIESREAGAVGFIKKPFKNQQLAELVLSHL